VCVAIAVRSHIADSEEPVGIDLPPQWVWDMIDEFLYQFQTFAQHCLKLKTWAEREEKGEGTAREGAHEEIELIKRSPQTWNVHTVLNILHSLVQKSCINQVVRVLLLRQSCVAYGFAHSWMRCAVASTSPTS
jgi:translation initiation factor 3 subunit L